MKYYNFFIDDNIIFLRDIAQKKYKNLFEHFFLRGLKDLHKKYDAKFTLNLFFCDSGGDFTLKMFPDNYYDQWAEVSSWLKLSFHSYAEAPPYPYKYGSERYALLADDYRLLKKEVLRFAPQESFIAPVIVHFFSCDATSDFEFLKSEGMKVFTVRECGNKDMEFSIKQGVYIIEPELFCNNMVSSEIENKLMQSISGGKRYLNIGTHEQYFYKDYQRYLPDHFERMDVALKTMTENNYKSVFFNNLINTPLQER